VSGTAAALFAFGLALCFAFDAGDAGSPCDFTASALSDPRRFGNILSNISVELLFGYRNWRAGCGRYIVCARPPPPGPGPPPPTSWNFSARAAIPTTRALDIANDWWATFSTLNNRPLGGTLGAGLGRGWGPQRPAARQLLGPNQDRETRGLNLPLAGCPGGLQTSKKNAE
jgi:hypothetical protein